MNTQVNMTGHASRQYELKQRGGRVSWIVLPSLTLVWFSLVGIGLAWMWDYEATPAKATTQQLQWPDDSQIERSQERQTLLLFAHPHCPCTRATIGELALIMTHCPDRIDAHVLFLKPAGFAEGWEKTDLWSSAEAIPGVKVFCDEEGLEAKRFRAITSGYALLFGPQGDLLFSGGITGSRGHSGDNTGRSAIETLAMNGQADGKQQTFVFGCGLLGQQEPCSGDCK